MLNAKDIRITTLVENTASRRGVLAEWGLCMHIQAGGHRILMDTGAGPCAVVHNANVMGIDLRRVDTIVLSHGHYDHTGGLAAVLQAMGKPVNVIAHPAVWDRKCSRKVDPDSPSYCGIPYRRDELERLGARFVLTDAPTRIGDDMLVSGLEPMTTDFEAADTVMCIRQDNGYMPDPLADDQSLYLRTDRGLVVVAGCAHRGIVNVIRHGLDLTGQNRVYLVLGGTHLQPAPEAQVDSTIAALKELKVQWIGVSHCTGLARSLRLAQEFGDRFFFNNTGSVVALPLEKAEVP